MSEGNFRVTLQNENSKDFRRVVTANGDTNPTESNQDETNEEKMRTLWVGGLNDQCQEEVLYELFMNAGPLERIAHPTDKVTKKKKQFAFIVFEHEESIKYAYDLLNGIELYGQKLKLQHKETGLGLNDRNYGLSKNGGRSYSTSSIPAPPGRDGEQHPAARMMGFNPSGGGGMAMGVSPPVGGGMMMGHSPHMFQNHGNQYYGYQQGHPGYQQGYHPGFPQAHPGHPQGYFGHPPHQQHAASDLRQVLNDNQHDSQRRSRDHGGPRPPPDHRDSRPPPPPPPSDHPPGDMDYRDSHRDKRSRNSQDDYDQRYNSRNDHQNMDRRSRDSHDHRGGDRNSGRRDNDRHQDDRRYANRHQGSRDDEYRERSGQRYSDRRW